MGLFSRALGRGRPLAPEIKDSRAQRLIALTTAGRPQWTPRNFEALAREGFARNPVAYRCVRMIAEAAASLPFILYDGRQELTDHPLAALLERPNPRDSRATLLEALFGYLLASGNGYLEMVENGRGPQELYALRPDRMRVVPGADGWA
jgi:HK97 family phage portal protein